MAKILLDIVTPDKLLLSKEVDEVICPAPTGTLASCRDTVSFSLPCASANCSTGLGRNPTTSRSCGGS